MSLSPVFDIARGALAAQESVLNTVGHNLGNASRPSYSRQEVVLEALPPRNLGGLLVGSGVTADHVRQIVDPVVEVQLLEARSRSGEATAARDRLARLETILDDLGGNGLQDEIDAFFASADDVALHPQGMAEREVFLARAEALVERFRGRARELGELQRQVDDAITAAVPRINRLLDDIARLNGEIFVAEVGGQSANDLRDERRDVLGQLSGLLGIGHFEENGQITVTGPDGLPLVERDQANHLTADRATPPPLEGLDGRALARLGFTLRSGDFVAFSGRLVGGELGGLLGVRDDDIPSVAADLDRLADALVTAVNAVHTVGEDLDGNPGLPLFGGTGAGDLTVLITDPRRVAASAATSPSGPPTPEDNRNALLLSELGTAALDGSDPTFGSVDLGGSTFVGFLSSIVAGVGVLSQTVSERAEVAEAVTSALESQRAAISSVSTDEELLTLLAAQRAYQAAATLVNAATATIDAVLDMVR